MEKYLNLHGSSGVTAYQSAPQAITVQFGDVKYLYTYDSAGAENVEKMKQLAHAGCGLGTFISQHVHNAYASKLS